MVYGELGKTPLKLKFDLCMLKFWYKLAKYGDGKLSTKMYNLLKSVYDKKLYKSKWFKHIRNLLDSLGLSELWNNVDSYEWNRFVNTCKRRLKDQFIQKWDNDVKTNEKCLTYRIFKHDLKFENYLDILPQQYRTPFSKFRLCNHQLPVEKGRYKKIPRQYRVCTLCNRNCLGDEFPFLFECTNYANLRIKHLPRFYRDRCNVYKFDQLFNLKEISVLIDLVKFIKGAGKMLA